MNNMVRTIMRAAFCAVNFNDAQSHRGTSFVPFIGFLCFLFGLVLLVIGIVKISYSKHQWNLFYDQRDRKDFSDPKYAKEKKAGIAITAVGAVLLVISAVIL